MQKFKPEQKVILPNFLINGSRLDVPAEVKRYIHTTNRYEIYLNSTFIYVTEERIVDEKEFWDAKKCQNTLVIKS